MKQFRLFLSIVIVLFFTSSSLAQVNKFHTWNMSTGVDFLYPENNFRKSHSWGYGATFKAEYLFAKHTSVILSAGYYTLTGKATLVNPAGKSVTGIPVKAGGRYYFGNFYLGGEAGLLWQTGFRPNTGFLYSFFVGDELISGKNGNSLDITVRHEAWVTDQTRAFVALRLAYEFRLN